MENKIVLVWQDSTEACSSEGKLLNISDRGALVVSDSLVPSTGQVFIQLKMPVKTDWIAARVVRRTSHHELGMEFPDACQWDLKLATTMGIDFTSLFGLSDAERISHSGD
jgi:PilZ domain